MSEEVDTSAPRRRRWLMRFLALLLSFLLCEGGLRLGCLLSQDVAAVLTPSSVPLTVPDDLLTFRGNPEHPGHDAAGFRNDAIPERADVVAIGDSQTYGTSVQGPEAWPHQLADVSGRTVYDMGFAGWGPVDYLHVLDEGLRRHPALVVTAVYFGNDFFDAFSDVYRNGLLPELRDDDHAAELVALDDSIERRPSPWGLLIGDDGKPLPPGAGPGWYDRAERSLAPRLRTVAAVRAVRFKLMRSSRWGWDYQVALARAYPDELSVWEGEHGRTILTSPYRTQAITRDDPRIAAGVDITVEVLARMAKRCEAAGCELLVVLIPTKEFGLRPLIESPAEHVGYEEHCRAHEWVGARLVAGLAARGLAFLDVAPDLARCLTERHENSYLPRADGHPSPAGHRAIAEAVAHRAFP